MSNMPPPGPPPPFPPPPGSGPPGAVPPGSGSPGSGPIGWDGPTDEARNGNGTASLVLGILSILSGLFVIGIVFGIIGLVLGISGRRRANRGEATNGGVAVGGIVTSIIGILVSIAAIVFVVFLLTNTDFGSLVECLADADGDEAAVEQCELEFEDDLFRDSPFGDDN